MSQFRVTFLKLVYGDTGHACEICQRTVDVEARDRASAKETATRCFCDLENVMNWSIHADRLEITEIDPMIDHRSVRHGWSDQHVRHYGGRSSL